MSSLSRIGWEPYADFRLEQSHIGSLINLPIHNPRPDIRPNWPDKCIEKIFNSARSHPEDSRLAHRRLLDVELDDPIVYCAMESRLYEQNIRIESVLPFPASSGRSSRRRYRCILAGPDHAFPPDSAKSIELEALLNSVDGISTAKATDFVGPSIQSKENGDGFRLTISYPYDHIGLIANLTRIINQQDWDISRFRNRRQEIVLDVKQKGNAKDTLQNLIASLRAVEIAPIDQKPVERHRSLRLNFRITDVSGAFQRLLDYLADHNINIESGYLSPESEVPLKPEEERGAYGWGELAVTTPAGTRIKRLEKDLRALPEMEVVEVSIMQISKATALAACELIRKELESIPGWKEYETAHRDLLPWAEDRFSQMEEGVVDNDVFIPNLKAVIQIMKEVRHPGCQPKDGSYRTSVISSRSSRLSKGRSQNPGRDAFPRDHVQHRCARISDSHQNSGRRHA